MKKSPKFPKKKTPAISPERLAQQIVDRDLGRFFAEASSFDSELAWQFFVDGSLAQEGVTNPQVEIEAAVEKRFRDEGMEFDDEGARKYHVGLYAGYAIGFAVARKIGGVR